MTKKMKTRKMTNAQIEFLERTKKNRENFLSKIKKSIKDDKTT